MRRFLYVLLQCSWGIIQTVIGFIIFIFNVTKKHCIYHGAIVTTWNYSGSVSLGLFVFISNCDSQTYKRLLLHEYGHTIQSIILGFLYVPIILVPSLIWCGLPFFKKYRKLKSISYYSFYPEKWADFLGQLVIKDMDNFTNI